MKKLFTLLFMCVFAVAAKADITVYVQCDTAPFIWWWGGDNGFADSEGSWPGIYQLTETWTDTKNNRTFWKWTFKGVTTISFLFNNGDASDKENVPKTKDVKNATTDRYFTLDWNKDGQVVLEDITSEYGGELPDVVISSIGVSGNHNNWEVGENMFKTIGDNKFQYSADINAIKPIVKGEPETEGGAESYVWKFKFRPNLSGWIGYATIYSDTNPSPYEWLMDGGGNDHNFEIDLDEITEPYITFTLTFAGGKELEEGWTLEAEKGATNGITNVASEAKAGVKYNLAGQRVSNNYRGIVIENGRKMMVK